MKTTRQFVNPWPAILVIVAFPVLLGLNTGCDQVFSLDRIEEAPLAEPNAHTCRCTCFVGTDLEQGRDFDVCLPPALNANLGGAVPAAADLTADCGVRVKPTLVSILQTCGSTRVQRRLEALGDQACVCESFQTTRFVDACNGDCASVALAADCSNQTTATSVPGQEPLCLAEPSVSARRGVGESLFGDRSTCAFTGDVTVSRGAQSQSKPADGVIEISGRPCPGGSCNVGMTYRLDHVGTFGFDSFAGLASVEIRDVLTSGATTALATLDGAGNGFFGPAATYTSGRGTRRDEQLLGVFSDSRTRAFVGSNADAVGIGVDWAGHRCALAGGLFGAAIESSDTDVMLDVAGDILNEPPTAVAGPSRSVECTGPSGASFALDAAASTDPENNIVIREWRRGGTAGAEIVDADNDGAVTVTQALGTNAVYGLNVIDAFMSVSQAMTQVAVVDTTPPAITATTATPDRLWPPNHKMVPVQVSVTAQDVCAATSCQVVSVSSNEPLNGSGDGNTSVDWQITGPLSVNLRAERAGSGAGRIYTLGIRCADAGGNDAASTALVRVGKN